MEIRPWDKNDLKEIAAAERVCFTDPWAEADFLPAFALSHYCGFVAQENGVLLGYACGICVCEEGEVANIAVLPFARGKGLGARLLTVLLGEMKARGAEKCFLEVRVSNAPAIALYQKFGFTQVNVRKRYYPDGEDAFLMALEM